VSQISRSAREIAKTSAGTARSAPTPHTKEGTHLGRHTRAAAGVRAQPDQLPNVPQATHLG